MSFRTLRVSPTAFLDLVKAISAGDELILAGEPIPSEAALGQIRYDEAADQLEVELIARWPKDADRAVDFKYSVRRGPDLGAVRALGANGEQ